MNIYKNILLKLFVLFIILLIADKLIGYALQAGYFNAKYNRNYHTNYVVNKVDDDVLIFGASRASHHYIPSILSDSLQLSVTNCGSDGQSIYYHYGLLMKIKERYLPEIIILDLSFSDYNVSKFTIEGVKDLAPYYGSNKDLDSLINQISPFEKIKMVSMLYRYNSRIIDIIGDNFIKTDHDWINGYMPLYGQIKKNATNPSDFQQEENTIEQGKMYYLEKFITCCKQNNIKLFLCISPAYRKCEHSIDFTPIEKLAEKYDVHVFNYYCDSLFSANEQLFKDGSHLNHQGATVYSSIIGKEIKLIQ